MHSYGPEVRTITSLLGAACSIFRPSHSRRRRRRRSWRNTWSSWWSIWSSWRSTWWSNWSSWRSTWRSWRSTWSSWWSTWWCYCCEQEHLVEHRDLDRSGCGSQQRGGSATRISNIRRPPYPGGGASSTVRCARTSASTLPPTGPKITRGLQIIKYIHPWTGNWLIGLRARQSVAG